MKWVAAGVVVLAVGVFSAFHLLRPTYWATSRLEWKRGAYDLYGSAHTLEEAMNEVNATVGTMFVRPQPGLRVAQPTHRIEEAAVPPGVRRGG